MSSSRVSKQKPFKCETCGELFTRQENLSRHEKKHQNSHKYVCSICSKHYSRSDSLKLHLRRIHQRKQHSVEVKREEGHHYVGSTHLSNQLFAFDGGIRHNDNNSSKDTDPTGSPLKECSLETLTGYLNSFWRNFHPSLPIIHKPSFRIEGIDVENDLLLHVMCAIGLCYIPDEKLLCHQTYEYVLRSFEFSFTSTTTKDLQGAILAIYFGLFSGNERWFRKSISGQAQLVSISRESGIFQYTIDTDTTDEWKLFVENETTKRLSYSLYLIDGQMATLFNYPPKLTHYEIKHLLPCSDELWEASERSQWESLNSETNIRDGSFFLDSLQQTLIYREIPKSISSFGGMVILLSIHIMIRNMAQYAGILETVPLLAEDPFSRRSQLGNALNALRVLIPKKKTVDYLSIESSSMWFLFEANWNLAYIHLHIPDTVITSGIVEVSLEATIATAAALIIPQSTSTPGTALLSNDFLRIPYETHSLVASHVSFFLSSFQSKSIETNPALTMMFYKATLVAWQILKASDRCEDSQTGPSSSKDFMKKRLAEDLFSHLDNCPDVFDIHYFEEWAKSLLNSFDTWGIGKCAAISLEEMLSGS